MISQSNHGYEVVCLKYLSLFLSVDILLAMRCSAGNEHICQDCKQICQMCDANVCKGCMRDSMDVYCEGQYNRERYFYVLVVACFALHLLCTDISANLAVLR